MSLRYLLDTNTVSEPLRPVPSPGLLEKLEAHEGEVGIAALVWHELWFGCERLPRSRKRDAIERYLMENVRVSMPILAYDGAAAEWHAAERARLAARGHMPPFIDGQIAAIAAVNNLALVTANLEDFASFEGLRIEDWRG